MRVVVSRACRDLPAPDAEAVRRRRASLVGRLQTVDLRQAPREPFARVPLDRPRGDDAIVEPPRHEVPAPTPRSQAADVWLVNAVEVKVDARRERVEVAGRDVLDEPLVPLGRGVRRRGRDVRPSLHPRMQRALPREPRVREQLERQVRHVGPCPLAGAEVARRIPVEVRVRQ